MLFRSLSSRSSLLLKSTVPATLFVSRDMSTSTSASRSLSASKPAPSDSFPEYYQSKPHHSSKSGFQYPPQWGNSSKENNLIEFLKTRFFDWDEEPPLPKMQDRPKVLTPTYKVESKGEQEEDRIRFTSFGHASCHLQIPVPISSSNPSARKYQTITVLTDPVLSKRCSPFQFMGPARYTEAPTTIQAVASVEESDEVKAWPHIVAISHNHYDHLDYNTIYALANPPEGKSVPHFVCTLGVAQFFKDLGVPTSNISELDWWDSVEITSTSTKDETSKLKITCTPAQHFSGRGLGDRNKSLFGGFVFESLPSQPSSSDERLAKIYFTGDSGFGYIPKGTKKEDEDSLPKTPLFKEIGENLGPFDLALIPIGAFLPRAFMSTIHMNPADAVQAHQLVKSKQSYGIHFNVFRLTPEAINEPQKQLLEETKRRGVKEEEFTTIEIGETRAVEIGE